MSDNFRKKQYEQSAPIPAKFLMPDGSISDELPGGGGSGGSTSWNQVYSKPFNTISTDDFKVEDNELKLKASKNYSTEEKVIGKWIDGKPIYRKVLIDDEGFGSKYNEWENMHSATLFITDADTLLKATVMRTSDHAVVNSFNVRLNPEDSGNNKRLQYYSEGAFPGCNIVIVEYTKTTD